MTSPSAALPGQRSRPMQRRSAEKVEAILVATRHLLSKPDATFTIRDLADSVGFSVGSIYRYFDSIESVVDAALSQHTDAAEVEIGELLERAEVSDVAELFTLVLEHFIGFYRANPAFTQARFAGEYAHRYARVEEASNQRLVELLGDKVIREGLAPEAPSTRTRLVVHWSAIGAVLHVAFTADPAGSESVLDEARQMVVDLSRRY